MLLTIIYHPSPNSCYLDLKFHLVNCLLVCSHLTFLLYSCYVHPQRHSFCIMFVKIMHCIGNSSFFLFVKVKVCSKLFFLLHHSSSYSSFSWELLFLHSHMNICPCMFACARFAIWYILHFGTCQSIKLLHIGLFWISALKYQPKV